MNIYYLCTKNPRLNDSAELHLSHIREAFLLEDQAQRKLDDLLALEEEKSSQDSQYKMKHWVIIEKRIDDIDNVSMFNIWQQVDPFKKHRSTGFYKPLVTIKRTARR